MTGFKVETSPQSEWELGEITIHSWATQRFCFLHIWMEQFWNLPYCNDLRAWVTYTVLLWLSPCPFPRVPTTSTHGSECLCLAHLLVMLVAQAQGVPTELLPLIFSDPTLDFPFPDLSPLSTPGSPACRSSRRLGAQPKDGGLEWQGELCLKKTSMTSSLGRHRK